MKSLHNIYLGNQQDPTPNYSQNQIASQFITLVERHFREQKPLAFYAKQIDIQEKDLIKSIQNCLHKAPRKILNEYLVKELIVQIGATDLPMKELSLQYGFNSHAQFTRFVKSTTGLTPSRYRALKYIEYLADSE